MKLNMKKAFTLVEMLIVIVIIGILAAALIPRLTGVQSRARDVARVADAQQIGTALATWNLDNGVYINSGSAGPSVTSANTNILAESFSLTGRLVSAISVQNLLGNLVFRGLLKALPTETAGLNSTSPYIYQYYNSGSVFSLTMISEGGGLKSNFISGWTIGTSTTNRIIVPSNITQSLCSSVDQGAQSYVTGGVCITNVDARRARYVYAN